MKKWLGTSILAALLVPALAGAVMMQSGSIIVNSDTYVPNHQVSQPKPMVSNILQNPGFETGSLPPWTSNAWTVTNTDQHSGTYSAWDVGNNNIEQDFSPTDVTTITSVSAWEKQDSGAAFAAVDFIYSTATDEFLVAPGTGWTYIDMTSHLRSSGTLIGIRFWGYSGGGDQLTQLDDVDIEGTVPNPVATTTWGAIKGTFQK